LIALLPVSLTKVSKKTKEQKSSMITEVSLLTPVRLSDHHAVTDECAVQNHPASSKRRQVEILLAIPSWQYAQLPSQNHPKALERVCFP